MKSRHIAALFLTLGLSLAATARAEEKMATDKGVTEKAAEDKAVAPDASAHESTKHEFSAEDIAAFTDARIAAMKVGLRLTPAQEKNWPALESVLREMGAARAASMAERRARMKQGENRDALDGLRQRAATLSARAAELNRLADAAKPLHDSLDEAQKARFGVLLREASGGPRLFRRFGARRRDGD